MEFVEETINQCDAGFVIQCNIPRLVDLADFVGLYWENGSVTVVLEALRNDSKLCELQTNQETQNSGHTGDHSGDREENGMVDILAQLSSDGFI